MVHYWPHANDADGLMPLRALAFAAIATLVTFCAAVASYHLFEKHFLALKKYFSVRSSCCKKSCSAWRDSAPSSRATRTHAASS
jgi:peptidoglycan/LPS O-acetylase OafA/YrhL